MFFVMILSVYITSMEIFWSCRPKSRTCMVHNIIIINNIILDCAATITGKHVIVQSFHKNSVFSCLKCFLAKSDCKLNDAINLLGQYRSIESSSRSKESSTHKTTTVYTSHACTGK